MAQYDINLREYWRILHKRKFIVVVTAVVPVAAVATPPDLQPIYRARGPDPLRTLFRRRFPDFQAAYEQRLSTVPDGPAKTMGVALGSEVAAEVVRLRANDGRTVALAPTHHWGGVADLTTHTRRSTARR